MTAKKPKSTKTVRPNPRKRAIRKPLLEELNDFTYPIFAGKVATADEMREYLSRLSVWPHLDQRDRKGYIEMMCKSLAMFTENVNTKHDVSEKAAALINELSRRDNA
jgi:hypothetical protein